MPVARTMPMKALKTERTHEENQERAYIAASRRSDRSLEARVESARRASEIHKRRTGRGLKITVEDVANEEMYEEEDSHVPLQFSQLASHLTTGNAGFNHRLAAYLQTNVAMREMLADAVNNSYGPHTPQMGQPSNAGQFQGQMYQPMQQAQSPSTYRHAPYPSPRPQQQGHSSNHQHRASLPSVQSALPQNSPIIPSVDHDHRRPSMPAAIGSTSGSPLQTHTPSSLHSTPPLRPAMSSRQPSHYGNPQQSVSQSQQFSAYNMNSYQNDYSLSPLTTQLPAEAQGLLGSTLDMNNPINAMLMAGSGDIPSTYYDFGTRPLSVSTNVSGQQTHATMDGLGSTLAPSAIENQFNTDTQTNSFFNEAYMGDSTRGFTPSVTPGDDSAWESLLTDGCYDLPGSQTSQM